MDEMILETERLVLRKLEQSDFREACKLLQDPEVMYAYEGAFSDQEVQVWLDKMFRRYENDGFALWAVVEKGSGELIGQCGITYQEYNGGWVPEVGYLFRKEFWHKGIVTEASKALVELLKKDGIPYITATHDKNNPRSGNIMQQLGMKYCYSFKEQWQPKNILVTFRMYQLNFDGQENRIYKKYWNLYDEHFIEKDI